MSLSANTILRTLARSESGHLLVVAAVFALAVFLVLVAAAFLVFATDFFAGFLAAFFLVLVVDLFALVLFVGFLVIESPSVQCVTTRKQPMILSGEKIHGKADCLTEAPNSAETVFVAD